MCLKKLKFLFWCLTCLKKAGLIGHIIHFKQASFKSFMVLTRHRGPECTGFGFCWLQGEAQCALNIAQPVLSTNESIFRNIKVNTNLFFVVAETSVLVFDVSLKLYAGLAEVASSCVFVDVLMLDVFWSKSCASILKNLATVICWKAITHKAQQHCDFTDLHNYFISSSKDSLQLPMWGANKSTAMHAIFWPYGINLSVYHCIAEHRNSNNSISKKTLIHSKYYEL